MGKKLNGNMIYNAAKKKLQRDGLSIRINGVGCSDQFGIEVRFENTKQLRMFIPFPVYYVKDLTEEMLTECIDDIDFYVKQITSLRTDNKEESTNDDLAEI